MPNYFGFSSEPSSGSFLPIVKFDARAGQFKLVERVQTRGGFESEEHVLKREDLKMIVDFHNLETGFLDFTQGAPLFNLVLARELYDADRNPDGVPFPEEPESGGWKKGIRFMIKLPKQVSLDVTPKQTMPVERPIREMASNAKSFITGVNEAYGEYLANRTKHGENSLPVLICKSCSPQKTGQGAKSSVAYIPNFSIDKWVPRPADLVYEARPAAATAKPAQRDAFDDKINGGGNGAQRTRPATGAKSASAPPPKQTQQAASDDFG